MLGRATEGTDVGHSNHAHETARNICGPCLEHVSYWNGPELSTGSVYIDRPQRLDWHDNATGGGGTIPPPNHLADKARLNSQRLGRCG